MVTKICILPKSSEKNIIHVTDGTKKYEEKKGKSDKMNLDRTNEQTQT